MKKYLSFFRIRFINGLQYRAAAYAGVATQFAWGTLELLAFAAFYPRRPSRIPDGIFSAFVVYLAPASVLGLVYDVVFRRLNYGVYYER